MVARSRSGGPRSTKNSAKRSLRRERKGSGVGDPAHAALDPAIQHEALAARIVRERKKAFIEALGPKSAAPAQGSGRVVKALYDIARDSLDLFDSMLNTLELDPPLACKRGCIHCCSNQVSLSEAEALYLGFHLLETRSPERLLALQARTRGLVEALKGKSAREIGMERHLHPCLFLEEGTCSVYPARPLVCRGWNSVNADMCMQSNLSGDALAPIENHPLPRLLAESVQKGLLHGADGLGLEAGFLLMARALALLLEGGAEQGILRCTDDWLRGEPFFARARSG